MTTLTYQFEGIPGNTVTAGAEGGSAMNGSGTMIYATGGLFPGSTRKAQITGDRTIRTDQAIFDYTQPAYWAQGCWRIDVAPVGGNVQLTRFRDASGNAVAMATFKADGTIVVTFTGGSNKTGKVSMLGKTFWIQHFVDKDAESQTVYLYAANGLLAEEITQGMRAASPIVDCQIGAQGSGSTNVVLMDRVTVSHDQPAIVPDGSGVVGTYNLEGTAGTAVTAAAEGADDLRGAGTAVYEAGGLVSGSSIRARFTGERYLRTIEPAFGNSIDVRAAIQLPTSVSDSVLLFNAQSTDRVNLASLWVRSSGKLELRYGGSGRDEGVSSSVTINTDKPYWLLWQLRDVGGPAAKQTLTVVDPGSLQIVDELSNVMTPGVAVAFVDTGTQQGPSTAAVLLDAIAVAVIPLSIPGVASDPVKYVVVGACTSTDATISMRVPGATAVRAVITGDKFAISSQATPDATGRAKIGANALSPRGIYTAQPEMFDGTNWISAGAPATWRQPIPAGEVGTQLIAVLACQASRANPPSSIAMTDLLDVQPYGPVDLVVWNGDQHYGNVNTTVMQDHLDKIDNIIRDCVGMKRQHASTRTLIKRSDHDGGGDQNTFYHGDQILASKAASRVVYPQYPTNGGDPATDYEIWQEGRVLHIALDCRSNNRSAHSDPESSTKTLLGIGQRDAVIAALTTARPANVRAVVIYSDMGWLGTNFPGSKPDAWPWYSTERTMISNAIIACPWPVFIMQDDWHSMIWADPAQGALTRGAALVGGFAGTDRSTGNLDKMLPSLGGEYTGFWPPIDQSTGTQTIQDIYEYGMLKIVDTGPTISVTMIGRDAQAGVDRVKITKTYAVDAPAGVQSGIFHRIVTPRGQFDLDDAAGRWRLLADARPVPLPARTLGLATRPGGGSRLVNTTQDTATGSLQLAVFDYAEDGTPGAMQRNRDHVFGVLGSSREQIYQTGPRSTGLVTREAPCIIAAEASPSMQTLNGEIYTVPVIYLEPWRSVATYSYAAGLGSDLIDVALSSFDGSTAEITDALISLRGPGNFFTIVDSVTGCGFRWNIPGTGTPLAANAYVLVDTANWTSYLNDHLSFDPSEGEEHAAYITPIRSNYDPQGVLLPLTPAREPDGVWRIRVTVQSKATTGATQIVVRARARYR